MATEWQSIDVYEAMLSSYIPVEELAGSQGGWKDKAMHFLEKQQEVISLSLLGILAALLATGLDLAIDGLAYVHTAIRDATPWIGLNLPLFILYSLLGAVLALLSVRFVSQYAAGSGIPEMRSVLSGLLLKHYLDIRTLVGKAIGLVFACGSGLSIGREGPYVHLSSAIAHQLSQLKCFHRLKGNAAIRLQMVAAGCAVGVATTFGAPIGGVMFAVEVTSTYYLLQNLWQGLFAAIFGALTIWMIGSSSVIALFHTTFESETFEKGELIAFALLGMLCGGMAILFIKLVKWTAMVRQMFLKQHPRFTVLSISLLTALITFPFVSLVTPHSELIPRLFSPGTYKPFDVSNAFGDLSTFFGAKFFITFLSIGLPIPCGLYTPVFCIGAGIGRFIGEVMRVILPFIRVIPGGYAVVGAAAFTSAVTQTLSTVLIVLELTGQLTHILPVLVAVGFSYSISVKWSLSVYDVLLQIKGLPFLPVFAVKRQFSRTAAEISTTADLVPLHPQSTYADLSTNLRTSPYPTTPFVDESNVFLGTLSKAMIESVVAQREMELEHTLRHRTRSRGKSLQGEEEMMISRLLDSEEEEEEPSAAWEEAKQKQKRKEEWFASVISVDLDAMGEEQVSRGTVIVNHSALTVNERTPLTKVHFLFTMLGVGHMFVVTSAGVLVGVLTKKNLMDAVTELNKDAQAVV